MLQVKKSKRGIDNILALLRYTFPKLTRIFTPSHITVVSTPMSEVTGDHNMEVTVTGISEVTTGEVVLPYRAFDLTNCDCPAEIAAEMFSLTHVKAFLATKPIAIDELLFTKEGDSYRVTATEGAYTVFGEKIFTLTEGSEGPEPGDWYFHEGEWYYCTVDHVELKDICSPFLNDTDPNQIRTVTRSGESHDIPLNNIDTRYVTDMNGMFNGASSFNQDISKWDVSSVTNMNRIFQIATSFNQDISQWDVSNVTDMERVFYQASNFNQNISNWDVSNVTNMNGMFYQASSFNQDLSSWCVTKIKSKPYRFDTDSKLTTVNLPRWGTCPNR